MKKTNLPKSVIVTAVLGLACAIVYAVLGVYAGSAEPETVYPSAGLSDSIFELQNMTYEPLSGFTETVAIDGLSVTVDAAPGSEANVGGATVRVNNGFYFLYAAAAEGEETEGVLRGSLTGVFSPSADPLATTVRVLDQAEGNLHGCHASYRLCELVTADGKRGYVCLYRLRVGDTFGDVGGEVILGCASAAGGTQGFANLQGFARAMVGTMRIVEGKDGR